MGKQDPKDQALLNELRDWGGTDQMSAFEAVMWRAEVDPRLRSTTTSVLVLDRAPDWERLHAGHRWVTQAVTRFRQRVVEPALGIGNPVWVEDPDFDLDYHLRRVRLPEPGSMRQLLDLAQNLAMTPFDKARSPWEATVIEGLEGGRAAYVLKLHHATSDGLGIIQLLSRVLSRQRDHVERPAASIDPEHRPRRVPSAPALASRHLRSRLLGLPSGAVAGVPALSRSLGTLLRDPEARRLGRAYLDSARRVLATRPVPGSGLFKRRSLSWRFDGFEFPLAAFKAAGRAVEGSLNDVFLAGLIRGFRRYHDEMGVRLDRMPIGFPISIRTGDDPIGGNKFAGSQYAAPLDIEDPVQLVRHIQDFVRRTRAEPALDILIRLMPVVTRLPLAALTALTSGLTTAQDAQISNVPGLPYPVYLAGAEITQFFPFAPVPGCGMMIAMLSHNGRCCVGINTDRAAVTEPELLSECLRAGLGELLALGQGASAGATPRRSPNISRDRE